MDSRYTNNSRSFFSTKHTPTKSGIQCYIHSHFLYTIPDGLETYCNTVRSKNMMRSSSASETPTTKHTMHVRSLLIFVSLLSLQIAHLAHGWKVTQIASGECEDSVGFVSITSDSDCELAVSNMPEPKYPQTVDATKVCGAVMSVSVIFASRFSFAQQKLIDET